jgi:large subunit ribosomal protein L23
MSEQLKVNQERLLRVVLGPHVSEKGAILGEKYRQIVFKVLSDATKPEIKQAVEMLFEVKVSTVQVCNVKSKVRRFKQTMGHRKGWKKAYVALKEGYDINFTGTK